MRLLRLLTFLCYCSTANAGLITETSDLSNNPFSPTVMANFYGAGIYEFRGAVDPYADDPFDAFVFNLIEGVEISKISFSVTNIRVLETFINNAIETYSFGFSSANYNRLVNASSEIEFWDLIHGLSAFGPEEYVDGASYTFSLPEDDVWRDIDISQNDLFIVSGGNGYGDFVGREWVLFPGNQQGLSAFEWTYRIEVQETTKVSEPNLFLLFLFGIGLVVAIQLRQT